MQRSIDHRLAVDRGTDQVNKMESLIVGGSEAKEWGCCKNKSEFSEKRKLCLHVHLYVDRVYFRLRFRIQFKPCNRIKLQVLMELADAVSLLANLSRVNTILRTNTFHPNNPCQTLKLYFY